MSEKPAATTALTDSTPMVAAEVRYSLPELLAEVKIERAAAVFANEKMESEEIKKLFKSKAKSHAKKK
ncbi:MAG: hypothetical protein WCR49_10780 [Opitutae bacterium]